MIGPTGVVRVIVATKPVDFRKGAEGLAALDRRDHDGRPVLGGDLPVRAKRANQADLLGWHGSFPVCQAA
jgi:transposase